MKKYCFIFRFARNVYVVVKKSASRLKSQFITYETMTAIIKKSGLKLHLLELTQRKVLNFPQRHLKMEGFFSMQCKLYVALWLGIVRQLKDIFRRPL